MMYENLFVDIGNVNSLECVQHETRKNGCLLKAIGERGAVTFFAHAAYSKIYPYCCEFGSDVNFFDLGVIAFFSQLRRSPDPHGYIKNLKLGDTIPILGGEDALKCLRSCGFGELGCPPTCRRWINVEGKEIPEPADFLKWYLAASFCTLSRALHSGERSVSEAINEILDICRTSIGEVSGDDFDFMLKWHGLLEFAARSINHHIDIKDYAPNGEKIDAFLAFYSAEQQRIDRLVKIDSYAEHLQEISSQLLDSKLNQWKARLGRVEMFRSFRFPGTRHV